MRSYGAVATVIGIAAAAIPTAAHAADGDAGSAAVGFVLLILLIGLYFVPSIVANNRGHLSTGAIFIFNLFLGWTFLGWVLALVWSLTGNTRANAERYSRPSGA